MPATEVAAPYRLALVRPRSFCERTADLPVEPDAQLEVSYEPSVGLSFDEERRTVQVRVFVNAHVFEQEAGPPATDAPPEVEVELDCVFEFQTLDPFRRAKKVSIPRLLLAHLIGMSFSTARGVLVSRARHPVFQGAPLPVVSPVAFIDDFVEEKELDWVETESARPKRPAPKKSAPRKRV
jgi:hypothetical protein